MLTSYFWIAKSVSPSPNSILSTLIIKICVTCEGQWCTSRLWSNTALFSPSHWSNSLTNQCSPISSSQQPLLSFLPPPPKFSCPHLSWWIRASNTHILATFYVGENHFFLYSSTAFQEVSILQKKASTTIRRVFNVGLCLYFHIHCIIDEECITYWPYLPLQHLQSRHRFHLSVRYSSKLTPPLELKERWVEGFVNATS